MWVNDMTTLKTVIGDCGGPTKVAPLLGISVRGLYKWLATGSLPRTEYSGETNYAEVLAAASGGKWSAEEIREKCRPGSRDTAA